MAKCWGCKRDLPDDHDAHFKVGFLGVYLCNRCDMDARKAQNRIRLPEWEAAFKQLQATKQRRSP